MNTICCLVKVATSPFVAQPHLNFSLMKALCSQILQYALSKHVNVSVVPAAPGELQPFALQQLDFWAFDTRLVAQLANWPAVSIEAKIDHQDDLRTSLT